MLEHGDSILIYDFGSQYTQLIARRIRQLGVYCQICPAMDSWETHATTLKPKGVILSGGPESVHHHKKLAMPEGLLASDCPVLGICYGMQVLAAELGGTVEPATAHEFGPAKVSLTQKSQLLPMLPARFEMNVWMSHADQVGEVPEGFVATACSRNCPAVIIENTERRWYGVQYHPEVTQSQYGDALLESFVVEICGCQKTWNARYIAEHLVGSIAEQVGDETVVLGLSGGVDSAVVAALVDKAIGAQLHCVFVDTGLLRHNEVDQVMAAFLDQSLNLHQVDCKQPFFTALEGVEDPEKKRKIIGKGFIDAFDAKAKTLNAQWLGQGTIYPDIIESAGKGHESAHVIKSHHNVGGLPERMNLKLLEPLAELFKDEVREVGAQLGLPDAILKRHPFPGPGLAVRIMGEVTEARVEALQQADAIFIEALHEAGLYNAVSQAFAVYLPVKSVGVVGDQRRYADTLCLRSVDTTDFMTATWSRLPEDLLQTVSSRIVNEIPCFARVVYDITSKPPATVEWE